MQPRLVLKFLKNPGISDYTLLRNYNILWRFVELQSGSTEGPDSAPWYRNACVDIKCSGVWNVDGFAVNKCVSYSDPHHREYAE